jgi:hypothetical protein
MFPLHPDVALLLARERIAEDHRKAGQHRRLAEARRAQRSLRTPAARRLVDNTPLMNGAEIRIADAEPSHHNATRAVLAQTLAKHVPDEDIQWHTSGTPCR